eukprot:scaffold168977_cov16-Prasinocladus_malaysianus.AAC.1
MMLSHSSALPLWGNNCTRTASGPQGRLNRKRAPPEGSAGLGLRQTNSSSHIGVVEKDEARRRGHKSHVTLTKR